MLICQRLTEIVTNSNISLHLQTDEKTTPNSDKRTVGRAARTRLRGGPLLAMCPLR